MLCFEGIFWYLDSQNEVVLDTHGLFKEVFLSICLFGWLSIFYLLFFLDSVNTVQKSASIFSVALKVGTN